METFSALLAVCAGISPVTGKLPGQRLVTRSFGVFFDLRLNKRLNINSDEAGDLRRPRAYYDVIVMIWYPLKISAIFTWYLQKDSMLLYPRDIYSTHVAVIHIQ